MLFYIAIFFIPLAVWIILMVVSKRKEGEEVGPSVVLEECALCHEEFLMNELIEKEVGGYSRVYCFCGNCIEQLHREYQTKVGQGDRENERINE